MKMIEKTIYMVESLGRVRQNDGVEYHFVLMVIHHPNHRRSLSLIGLWSVCRAIECFEQDEGLSLNVALWVNPRVLQCGALLPNLDQVVIFQEEHVVLFHQRQPKHGGGFHITCLSRVGMAVQTQTNPYKDYV